MNSLARYGLWTFLTIMKSRKKIKSHSREQPDRGKFMFSSFSFLIFILLGSAVLCFFHSVVLFYMVFSCLNDYSFSEKSDDSSNWIDGISPAARWAIASAEKKVVK